MLDSQDILDYAPLYCIVGIYRLLTDPHLWKPIWKDCAQAAKKGTTAAAIWGVCSFPVTRYVVKNFTKPFKYAKYEDESRLFGVNIVTYATCMFVLGQCSMVLQYFTQKKLKAARIHAYDETVKSRGKDASFWIPYVEEWAEPPLARAKRAAVKSTWYDKVNSPFVRMIILKGMLLPLAFIPFLGMIISAFLRSLTMAKILHQPYFKAKKMDDFQQELFMVERQFSYRCFGCVAALLERAPMVGLVFSISNRVGAAMWAHALEKQQHAFAEGQLKPTKIYQSKTAAIPPSDLPSDFAGSFPTSKAAFETETAGSEGIASISSGSTEQSTKRRNVPPKWEQGR